MKSSIRQRVTYALAPQKFFVLLLLVFRAVCCYLLYVRSVIGKTV